MYFFFALYNNRKLSFQMSTIRSNRKCSKVVRISSDIFRNVWKSSENCRKSGKYLEVAPTFFEIPVMGRQKSHAFDLEKVGRYVIIVLHFFCFNQPEHKLRFHVHKISIIFHFFGVLHHHCIILHVYLTL